MKRLALWLLVCLPLSGLADERILPEAIATSRSKNPVMRNYITQLIAEFNNPAASEALLHLAYDENEEVRRQAITGLTRHKADVPAKDLVHLLQNAQGQEIQYIKALLRNCKDPELGKHLVKVLLSKNNDLIAIIMDVLKDIVDIKARDPFAVVVAKAELEFSSKYYSDIKQIVDDARLFLPTVSLEHVVLSRNSLTFPVVFYMMHGSGGWKLMLFTQDRFPVEEFEDFIADYDVSIGQFQWMAGAQAQVFWEEASLQIYNKNKE